MLNELYQSLDPVAFTIGSIEVRWYGLAYLAGFILAGVVMFRTARRWGLPLRGEDALVLMEGVAIGVIVGARLFYVLFYNLPYYLENPLHVFMFTEGGMSFHGGMVGALVGGWLVCRMLRLSLTTMADLVAIGAPIGLFFGRLANFVNGELWGKPCDLPWGVAFASGGGVMRHPSQLYEALLEGVVLFVILFAFSRRVPARPQGTFLGTFLTCYGFFRILIEFVRVPDEQLGYLLGPITMGQVLSLPVMAAGVALLVWAHKTRRTQSLAPVPRARS